MACVYLIHFTKPLGHSRHYLGRTCLTPEQRLKRHMSGDGAKLIQLARNNGSEFIIARVWNCATYAQSAELEHRLKARNENIRLCPICNPETATRWGNYKSLQQEMEK